MKKLLSVTILALSLAIPCITQAMSHPSFVFYRNLSVGDSGSDVKQLQILLNKNSDTVISAVGLGSPGNETEFFGAKTKAALIRFQNIYAGEVLAPIGLPYGTGYFGPATRTKANGLLSVAQTKEVQLTNVSTEVLKAQPSISSLKTSGPVVGKGEYASYVDIEAGLEMYIDAMKKVAKDKGYDTTKISMLEERIREGAAANPNIVKDFVDQIKKENATAKAAHNSFSGRITALITSLRERLVPTANAGIGIQFGARNIVFIFYCNCSQTYQLTLYPPLPPTYAVTLDYIFGTQAFQNYNTPIMMQALLGMYIPGAGICEVYSGTSCNHIPSYGLITPMLGSSLGPAVF